MSNDDADHAARAVLAGRPTGLGTDDTFMSLTARGFSPADLRSSMRGLHAAQILVAIEGIENAPDPAARFRALLRLARALSPYWRDRATGWFRFLVSLGSDKGESPFRLTVLRRPHSTKSQPSAALRRTTKGRQNISDMLNAGAILSRISLADAQGRTLTIQDAIEGAINEGEIETDEEAARKSFHRFRKLCERLSGGAYLLQRYSGSNETYKGRWTAIPTNQAGSRPLPSPLGGRPKT